MKILLLTIVISIAIYGNVYGEQRYNAFENRWETVPDNSDWTPRYNAFENTTTYQPKDAIIEYNAFENTFDWKQQPVITDNTQDWGWK